MHNILKVKSEAAKSLQLHFREDIECRKPADDTGAVCREAGRLSYSLTIGQERNLPILEERMFGSKSGQYKKANRNKP